MNFTDHVEQLVEKDGGLLVRAEFLGADGAAVDSLSDSVVADVLASDRSVA